MIYLNNAATSYPKPLPVIENVTGYLQSAPIHAARTGFSMQKKDKITACRESLATLFNIPDPSQIVFTSGSTEAINLAISGLCLENAHVITTAIEHNSVLRPLKTLEKCKSVTLTIVDCDESGFVNPEDIENAISEKTRLIALNHCSNVTGATQDVSGVASIAKKYGCLTLIDISQSAGTIPIDVIKWDIDLMAFTGHKSLFGIPGIGGLYIKPGIALKPLKVGGTGVRSDYLYQPEEMPVYFEAGTPNTPGIVSLEAGIDFITKTGIENIKQHKEYICNRIFSRLAEFDEVILFGAGKNNEKVLVINFCINGMEAEETGFILEESFGIIARSGLHCAPLIHKALGTFPAGSVRVSPSFFTTEQEADYLLEAVEQIIMAK